MKTVDNDPVIFSTGARSLTNLGL